MFLAFGAYPNSGIVSNFLKIKLLLSCQVEIGKVFTFYRIAVILECYLHVYLQAS
jgi:hypothetical protein